MSIRQKDRIFFEALAKLNSYIEENIKTEGFLPSESKMCELFEVSRVTFRSAVAAFRQNGFIISYPKKGHYVLPRHYRVKKVGVVLGNGKESPFFQLGNIFAAMVEDLSAQNISVQLIQSSLPDNLRWRAFAHGVLGLVWIYPPLSMRSMIDENTDSFPYAELVIDIQQSRPMEEAISPIPTLTIDSDRASLRRANLIADRGHKVMAYTAGNAADCERVRKIFSQISDNFEQVYFVSGENDWPSEVIRLVEHKGVTAVVTSGHLMKQEQFVEALNALQLENPVEVFLPNEHLQKHFERSYPKLRFTGYSLVDWRLLGKAAAEQLAANILSGVSMESRKVPCYKIDAESA